MEEGKDWTASSRQPISVLTPAACYPLLSEHIAKRGALPEGADCLTCNPIACRHEPSKEPTRMQLFRMREYVRMVHRPKSWLFRQDWMERGTKLMAEVGLPVEIDVANDPFFGRARRM